MIGFVISLGFTGTVFAIHDPNQPLEHSIILPPNMRGNPFEEFMEWCTPLYEDLCTKLEKNRIPKIMSPLKQFKSGVSFDEIQCKENLVLLQKHDGSPTCVTSETKTKLLERGWMTISSDFETQREIAKEIFKSLRTGEHTPYTSFGLSDDRKSLDLYFDKTAFTLEKNEAYYQEFIDEAFAEVEIPINIIFVEGQGNGNE